MKFKHKVPNNFEKSRITKQVALKAGSIFGVRSSVEKKKLDALTKIRTRGVDPSLFACAASAAALPVARASSTKPTFGHIRVVRPKD